MNVIMEVPVLFENEKTAEYYLLNGEDCKVPYEIFTVKHIAVFSVNGISPIITTGNYSALMVNGVEFTVKMNYDDLYHLTLKSRLNHLWN